jgi:tol-pal system protein YbgF
VVRRPDGHPHPHIEKEALRCERLFYFEFRKAAIWAKDSFQIQVGRASFSRARHMNRNRIHRLLPAAVFAGLSVFSVTTEASGNDVVPQVRATAVDRNPSGYQIADLFGESDEEKAARLQQEQSQNASINYARQRVEDMETSIRRLTGQVEQLDHRITELNSRIERMQKDFDYRLCTMAQQQLNTAGGGESQGGFLCGNAAAMPGSAAAASASPSPDEPATEPPAAAASQGSPPRPYSSTSPPRPYSAYPPGGATSPPPAAAKAASPPPPPGRASGEPLHLAQPPGNLSTLPAKDTPAASAVATSSSPSTNRGKFDAAMKLLAKAQYDEARGSFRAFADNYPQDELAPQAVYWIGDIALVQKDYPNAARAFAEEIKKYPDSARSPDSMLKLGQSLIAMGQKQEGCTALGALPTKYPNASKAVIARAAQDRKASACR